MEIDHRALEQTFLREAEEKLQEADECALALGKEPPDPEAVDTLFRLVHTVKGSAATVGYDAVAELAHVLEDLLHLAREGAVAAGADLCNLVLEGLDAIRQLIGKGNAPTTHAPALIQLRIQRLVELATRGKLKTTAAAPAAPAASPAEAPRPGAEPRRSLRVDVEKLDRMLDLIGEIGIGRVRLERQLRRLPDAVAEDARDAHQEADRLFRELQEMVLKARTVPISLVFRPHLRNVRDLAARLGREATVELQGADVEVDTGVLEALRDALTHLVRNAVGHGIEAPAAREAAGKPRAGTITLRARQAGGAIIVEVEDDGGGLNRGKILERAARLGMVVDASMSDDDVYDLVFRPGFSTAGEVTDVSGRGVGLDVVRSKMRALRGDAVIRSKPGRGSMISLRFPLTLTLIEGLYVGVADDTYVVPLDAVVECVALAGTTRPRDVIMVRGKAVPFVRLRDHFRVEGKPSLHESAVVVTDGTGTAGLGVDGLFGQRQTVVKPLSGGLGHVPVFSGSVILGSGRVALILDVPALIRQVETGRGAGAVAQGRGSGQEMGWHP